MRGGRVGARLACVLGITLLAACAPGEREFGTLAELSTTAPELARWLPAGLPPDVTLIRVRVAPGASTQAEGQFHFSSASYARLVTSWPAAALPLGEPTLDAFATKKSLRGYEARTAQDGTRRWLLMCSEAKGRCYFVARAL